MPKSTVQGGDIAVVHSVVPPFLARLCVQTRLLDLAQVAKDCAQRVFFCNTVSKRLEMFENLVHRERGIMEGRME